MGARKVAVFGLGPIGCTPASIKVYGRNGIKCVEFMNDAVQLFNEKLKSLVDEFNAKFHDAKFTYINIFNILSAAPAALGKFIFVQYSLIHH